MKRALTIAALAGLVAACASMQAIGEAQLGLQKGSVFDTATPAPSSFEGAGRNSIAPPADSGMPPMIAHAIDEYLPITASSNGCVTCHHKPAAIGKPVAKGQPTPAPASHHAQRGAEPALAGANDVCSGCHAPQAGVKPLVDNRSLQLCPQPFAGYCAS